MSPRYIVLVATLLAGCGGVPTLPSVTPYKMDIQQGNVVTQEMVAKLKPGMTRQQVRFALGTPLVVDPFRTDRWDYVYLYEKAGRTTEQRHIAVIFKDDKLARIEGDVVPAASPTGVTVVPSPGEAKAAAAASAAPQDGQKTSEPGKGEAAKSPEEKPEEERGFFGRMLEKLGF